MAENAADPKDKTVGTVLTKKGIRLIAKMLGSEAVLKITRVAVGTGSIPEGVEPREMEDLGFYKMDGLIARVGKVEGEDQVNIAFQIDSVDVEESFVITEAGVYAEDPDEGEILYGYLDMTDDPQLVYHSKNAISKMVEITMAIIVATTDQIDVKISPGSLVSIKDFEEFRTEIREYCDTEIRNAIADLQRQIGDLTKLLTENKCCLVDAINEIAGVVKPLITYSIATDQDMDDIVSENYADDADWVSTLDIAAERDIDAIVDGTYVEEEEDDMPDMATNEDIDNIVAGTYVEDEDPEEYDPTSEEIKHLMENTFEPEETE